MVLLPFGVPGRRSGRTGGGCRRSRRCRGPSGVRAVGVVAGAEANSRLFRFAEEAGEAAAIGDDGVAEFVPECPVELAGRDAEVAADIGDDGADRAATHLGGDFLFRGQAGEARVLGVVGGLGFGLGVRRCDLPSGARPAGGGLADGRRREVLAAGGALAKPGFQSRGAAQAIGDAGEDDGEIGGAEGSGEQGEAWGGSALLNRAGELPAVVDQFADEAEDAAEGGGHGRVGPGRIGVRGWGGGWGGGGHERNKNTREEVLSRKIFLKDDSVERGERRRRPCTITGIMVPGSQIGQNRKGPSSANTSKMNDASPTRNFEVTAAEAP